MREDNKIKKVKLTFELYPKEKGACLKTVNDGPCDSVNRPFTAIETRPIISACGSHYLTVIFYEERPRQRMSIDIKYATIGRWVTHLIDNVPVHLATYRKRHRGSSLHGRVRDTVLF